jgi:hypothetical protein
LAATEFERLKANLIDTENFNEKLQQILKQNNIDYQVQLSDLKTYNNFQR